jgi:16S rRNA processing protein RimM
MAVKAVNGYDLGIVSGLMETGSNDVLVVDAKKNDAFGKTERLIPYIQDDVIISVNKEENTITVDWDPGF